MLLEAPTREERVLTDLELDASQQLYNPAAWQIIAAAVLFMVTYAFLITEKMNRAIVALLGALMMIILGILDMKQAIAVHMNWSMIGLLIGMMILVGMLNRTGIFQSIAVNLIRTTKGSPIRLLIGATVVTGIASALLDQMTTVLVIVPITLAVTRILKITPIPFLISEIMASNIGGTATLIGSSSNMMIGTANPHLSFNDFIVQLGPITVIILIATLVFLIIVFRKQLTVTSKAKAELMKQPTVEYRKDRKLVIKSAVIALLTLIGFALHAVLGIDPAVVALGGALLLMIAGLSRQEARSAIEQVEWKKVFFFIGLYMLVGGLVETNIVNKLAYYTMVVTSGDMTRASILIVWLSGMASATIDHIPLVAAAIPVIQQIGVEMSLTDPEQLNPLWWSLALGANLGGNGTLLGASANVVAVGLAMREGKSFSFVDFLKIGVPVTLLSLVISTLYVTLVMVP